ncbi:cysteine--tRNA ligase [Salsipaludibacter albus]|uniref:cysteine--tRNA ligase n=1 Tax=Salsipaludibacter albus TaxID=2849650 RepID=UPI001EE40300|nr:cysteine--tRNA ligase [Salsipaludibacter albus]MBY5160937.1 cysteine--tRNA ligase [Salsipaludibacter albus]
MALQLYDSLRREQVDFEPRDPGKASLYVCGPTVQDKPHVGHGRASVVFDVLRRWLTWSGYEVTHVTNVTDVDDKIILKAQLTGTTPAMVATENLRAFNQASDALGLLPVHVQPMATGHLFEMQDMISRLIDKEMAYERDGNVLFRVRTLEDYGKLSRRDVDDMRGSEDIIGAESKDDPIDFAMWKAAKPGEPSWPSPWGDGRPGWHIECAAMAGKHLGPGFDIHGGGLDLVFPHHENEIAQFEAAEDAPFARYWVHNGMLRMGEDKMSKSIGNVIGIVDAVETWGRGPLRLWYLSAHHRSPLTYDTDRLVEASAAFDRLATLVRTVRTLGVDPVPLDRDDVPAVAAPHVDRFTVAMDDDLNATAAVSVLHDAVTVAHEHVRAAETGDDEARTAAAVLAGMVVTLADDVLGLGLGAAVERDDAVGDRFGALVEHLIGERTAARDDRDFARADAIRDQLAAAGVVVEDRPNGSRWYLSDPAAPVAEDT